MFSVIRPLFAPVSFELEVQIDSVHVHIIYRQMSGANPMVGWYVCAARFIQGTAARSAAELPVKKKLAGEW